jgi:multiple sugar transport system substrate-binding protein
MGAFPARRSTILSGPYEPWQGPVLKALQQGYDAAEAGKMWRIRSPKSDQAQTILADETARALNGEVSVAEALDNAARKIDRLGL